MNRVHSIDIILEVGFNGLEIPACTSRHRQSQKVQPFESFSTPSMTPRMLYAVRNLFAEHHGMCHKRTFSTHGSILRYVNQFKRHPKVSSLLRVVLTPPYCKSKESRAVPNITRTTRAARDASLGTLARIVYAPCAYARRFVVRCTMRMRAARNIVLARICNASACATNGVLKLSTALLVPWQGLCHS